MKELRALGYELQLVETNATFPFHMLAEVV